MTITLRAGVLNSGIQQNGTEFLTVDTSNNATLSNNLTVTGVATLGAGAVLGTPASGNLANCTGVPVGALPAGSILQVISTQATTPVSVSTGGYVSIGLSSSITVSANSKVLVLTVVPWYSDGSGGTWGNAGTSALFQDGSLVTNNEHFGTTSGSAAWNNPLNYMSSPLSAGSHTFEVKHGLTISGTHYCMRDGKIGTIMLLEIKS